MVGKYVRLDPVVTRSRSWSLLLHPPSAAPPVAQISAQAETAPPSPHLDPASLMLGGDGFTPMLAEHAALVEEHRLDPDFVLICHKARRMRDLLETIELLPVRTKLGLSPLSGQPVECTFQDPAYIFFELPKGSSSQCYPIMVQGCIHDVGTVCDLCRTDGQGRGHCAKCVAFSGFTKLLWSRDTFVLGARSEPLPRGWDLKTLVAVVT